MVPVWGRAHLGRFCFMFIGDIALQEELNKNKIRLKWALLIISGGVRQHHSSLHGLPAWSCWNCLNSHSRRFDGFPMQCMPNWILEGRQLPTLGIYRKVCRSSIELVPHSLSCVTLVRPRRHKVTGYWGISNFSRGLRRQNSHWLIRLLRGRKHPVLFGVLPGTALSCCTLSYHPISVIWRLILL